MARRGAEVEAAQGAIRPQVAALCFRRAPDLEILLVTSRETGRWVIPKGKLMKGLTLWEAAAQEALEEAGVVGKISRHALGEYDYVKFLKSGLGAPCRVTVFPLEVREQLSTWLEQHQRESRWYPWAEAAEQVHEPGLATIIAAFSRRL